MRQQLTQWVAATLLTILLSLGSAYATEPQLIINIVVGSLRNSDLDRYEDNFTEGGFKRLMSGGVRYTNAHYDFIHTSTPAGLATIATGTQPSVHGIVGESWWNYVDSSRVNLIADNKVHPVPYSTGAISCSPHRLATPTISDMLLSTTPQSKSFTIAVEPLSAIILTGHSGIGFWAETNKTNWTTSSAYITELPKWVTEYNTSESNAMYVLKRWTPLYNAMRYHNNEVAVMEDIKQKSTKLISDIDLKLGTSKIGQMRYTPAGNKMLLEFAEALIAQERLGADANPDILNIVLDTPRYIASTYGTESMEWEDMLYRLDNALAEFLTYLYAQVNDPQKVVVVLTSDHGTSPSYNPIGGRERERFNVQQMKVIVNAFLGARYGSDNYILGFANNALYLNHELILRKRISLDTVREEVATFMLQLRGVATAISSSALRNTSFSEGRSRLMQQSFYATRSGDVVIDFMPGWIIEESGNRSAHTSGYNYDREVPLIFYGIGTKGEYNREVSMVSIAPTIAEILNIERPWATVSRGLNEVVGN